MPKGTTLSSYNPSLRDKIAWALSDAFGGGDRGRVNYINEKVRGAVDFAPVLGDVLAFDDARSNFNEGNYGSAALDAASGMVGLVPGGGDMAAGILAAGRKTPWVEMFHGTHNDFENFELGRNRQAPFVESPVDSGIHVTPDPLLAGIYAGLDPMGTFPVSAMEGGRIMPVLVDKGNRLVPKKGRIYDPGDWVSPDNLDEAFSEVSDDPNVRKVMGSIADGANIRDALVYHGFDSFDYMHQDPFNMRDMSKPATMLTDPGQLVPRYSTKGMSLDYSPSKFKKHRGYDREELKEFYEQALEEWGDI